MFYQKRDSFCQGCHFHSNRPIYIFSFLSFFDRKSLIHLFFDRQRWAAVLVEAAEVKEEINNTCRNCKSKRIV